MNRFGRNTGRHTYTIYRIHIAKSEHEELVAMNVKRAAGGCNGASRSIGSTPFSLSVEIHHPPPEKEGSVDDFEGVAAMPGGCDDI